MKAIDEKIGKFVGNSDTVFIIPPFQRNYSWDEEQCEELFNDILDSVAKGKSHYIGNIVYVLLLSKSHPYGWLFFFLHQAIFPLDFCLKCRILLGFRVHSCISSERVV